MAAYFDRFVLVRDEHLRALCGELMRHDQAALADAMRDAPSAARQVLIVNRWRNLGKT